MARQDRFANVSKRVLDINSDLSSVVDACQECAVKWNPIGLQLGLVYAQLQQIAAIANNPKERLQRVLVAWLQKDTIPGSPDPSYYILCHAVAKGGGNPALAERIAAAHPASADIARTVDEDDDVKLTPHHETDQDYFKALKLGRVKTRITKAVVQGEARSGKTSLKCLLLGLPYSELSTSPIEAPKLAILSDSQSSDKNLPPKEAYGRLSTNQFGRSYGKSWRLVNDENMYSIVLDELQLRMQSIKNSKLENNPEHNHSQQIELEAIAEVNELIDQCKEIEGEENLEFNQEWLYFIDSGGQIQFQKLVPVFIPFASVLLLVIKLSKSLKGEASTAMQLEHGQQIRVSEHSLTVEEVLKQLLSAIASSTEQFKSTLPAGITPPPEKLNVIAVATHCDEYDQLVKEKKDVQPLEEIETMLNKIVIPYKQKCQLKRITTFGDARKILHEVDGSKALRSEYDDPVVEQIAKSLATQAFEVDVPIAWYCFGVLLHKIAKDGCGVLSLSYCQALGMRLQIPEDEVASALKFLHILNMLLYYPDSPAVADMVFVQVHSLIDIIRELVILVCKARKNWEAETEEVMELATKGYLSVEVLGELPEECTLHKIKQKFDRFGTKLLGLFEDLLIAARLPEKGLFFTPSLLPVKNISIVNPSPNAGISPLLFFFKDAVPMGLFCAFIVYLLSITENSDNPWRIIVTDLNCSNYCTLQNTNMMGIFVFVETPDCIEMHARKEHLPNAEVADVIEKAIKNTIVKQKLKEIMVEKAFYCDCQFVKTRHVGIVNDKCMLECTTPSSICRVLDKGQLCWFQESVSTVPHSPQVSKSAAEQDYETEIAYDVLGSNIRRIKKSRIGLSCLADKLVEKKVITMDKMREVTSDMMSGRTEDQRMDELLGILMDTVELDGSLFGWFIQVLRDEDTVITNKLADHLLTEYAGHLN